MPWNSKEHDESDAIRNNICFRYLQYIQTKLLENKEQESAIDKIRAKKLDELNCPQDFLIYLLLSKKLEVYDEYFAYGNMYTRFMQLLERQCENEIKNTDVSSLTKLLLEQVYGNESNILENAYSPKTSDLSSPTGNCSSPKKMNKRSKLATPILMHTFSENISGSFFEKPRSLSYKPMLTTNMPSIRTYQYKKSGMPSEIRMGTQVHSYFKEKEYKFGLNPIFEMWLKIRETDNPDKKTKHVYFNKMKNRIESFFHPQDNFESDFTKELHRSTRVGFIVITLPANNKLIAQKSQGEKVFSIFLENAEKSSEENHCDFHINIDTQKLLFGENQNKINTENRKKKLTELLNKSFKAILNIENPSKHQKLITLEQINAVYFHFINFELTNFILEKLKPDTFNFTCKDGIDRGGIASLYYNLMKSIECGKLLSEVEFQQGLHAAPLMVKGREMNHHIEILRNAIGEYIKNNSHVPEWLEKWCIEKSEGKKAGFFAGFGRSLSNNSASSEAPSVRVSKVG